MIRVALTPDKIEATITKDDGWQSNDKAIQGTLQRNLEFELHDSMAYVPDLESFAVESARKLFKTLTVLEVDQIEEPFNAGVDY